MSSRSRRIGVRLSQRKGAHENPGLMASLAASSDRRKAMERFEEGRLQLNRSNFREAEKLFGQAMYFDSSVSRYHFYQGLAMVKQCAYKDAERAFERARELDPENADYTAELGFVCLELGLSEKARAFFKAVLRTAPSHGRATEGMGRLGKC
jgi:tetratricopeptide (TPR) repeat protein